MDLFDVTIFDDSVFDTEAIVLDPALRETFQIVSGRRRRTRLVHELREELAHTTFAATSPLRVVDFLLLQISGTSIEVSGRVERSTNDPSINPNWTPIGAEISGSATEGIPVVAFDEPTRAWWRFRPTLIVGGKIAVTLQGGKPFTRSTYG